MIIDKSNTRFFHDEVSNAIKALAEKHNLTLTKDRCTYYPGQRMTFKIEIAQVNQQTGISSSKEASDFTLYANRYGLDPKMLGKTFTVPYSKQVVKITGFNTRKAFGNSPKYPVLADDVNTGLKYKFSIEAAKTFLPI